MAKIDFPKKQEQRLIPKYLLEYTEELVENHPDPTDPWGGSGGDTIEAGTGITITTESDDTKVISLDTNPSTFEVTADTGMTLEVENSNPLWTDAKLQMAYTGATRLEGTLIDLYASNGMYFHSDYAPYYVNNTTHEYKTLATTDQLFSGDYDDLYNKPTIPDAVSGTNDGTNWTSLTIGEDTYGLASGGSTYTAGTGIDITNDTISVDTSTVAMKTDIPTDLSDLNNDVGYITGINSSDVITALGYTPGTSNFSGSYTDLTDKPTIPTATSQLNNDSGFITNSDQNVEYIFITSTSSTPQTFTLTNDQIDAIVLNPTKYIIVYDYQPTVGDPRIYFRYQYQNSNYFHYASLDYYKDEIDSSGVGGYRNRRCQFSLVVSGTNKGTITMTNANQDFQKMLTTGTGISMSNNQISVNTNTIATRTWVGNQGYLTSSDLSNYVTTNTSQDITANKTFKGTANIYVQSGDTYTSSDTLITNSSVSASTVDGTTVSAHELALEDSTTAGHSQIRVRDFTQTPFVDYRIEVPTKNGTMALTSDIITSYNDLTNKPDLSIYAESSDLATVATSGSYNDLSNKPTIPTVNDNTITITQGGVTKGSFTLNQNTNQTIEVDNVPGMIGEVIFSNTSGSTDLTLTMAHSFADYSYIDIQWANNDGITNSTRIYDPNGKTVNLLSANVVSTLYIDKVGIYSLSGTAMTQVSKGQGAMVNGNNSIVDYKDNTQTSDYIKITKVIGYKANSSPLTSETWTFTLQDGTTTTKKIMLG